MVPYSALHKKIERCQVKIVDISFYMWYSIDMQEQYIENLRYQKLFDLYEKLLTEVQREVFYLHFMCDLSLTEIAEQKQVSKQSVSMAVQTAKQLLQEYEDKLCLLQKRELLLQQIEELLINGGKIERKGLEKLKELI